MGTILRVDLTNRTIVREPLDEEAARAFIGGAGYGTKVIHDEVPGDTDPLGPANKLVFMTGPLTGTAFPTTPRYQVCTKSPLTNMWLTASSAGWWARDFKLAGFDGLIVEGKADVPVYLWINDGEVEIRDARPVGLDSDRLRKRSGRACDVKVKVSCIGQAGEKQILLPA
jgi:aldehyde:ferredoxin oxidoreductase